ncbi:MAG: hypothetical protein D8M59_09230 [Planctomycetes bacterium]|nr:hypothetical protein [Planctomycetota bacterium]NOG54243.1 hypothetical protein [Planctomycetota bacterium]
MNRVSLTLCTFLAAGATALAGITTGTPPTDGPADPEGVYQLGWSEFSPGSEMWSEGSGYLIAGEVVWSDSAVMTGGSYTLLPGSGTFAMSPPIEMLTGNLYLRSPTMSRVGALSTLLVHGATPGDEVVFTCDFRRGLTELNGCVGVAVELSNPQIVDTVITDEEGMARLSLVIPRDAADKPVIFQAVEANSCRVSNPVVCTFN